MPRLLKRAAIALMSAVVAVAIVAWFAVRASLPELDGELVVDGLEAGVLIERDDRGIPVISAPDRATLAFGTGFAHAQDRFFQMDLLRRQAAGELAALVGPSAVPVDRRHRLHRFRHRAGIALAELTAAQRSVVDAYAAGVNAGLDSLGGRPFEYYLLNAAPEPWRAEDTVLVGFAMFLELNDSTASRDVGRGFARKVLPGDLFAFLYPDGSSWDAPLVDEAMAAASMPGNDSLDLRTRRVNFVPGLREYRAEDAIPGSNNWAVSGELTASGRAIVANDMHLGIATPNIWYRARLVQTDGARRDVSGVSLPGTPVIVAGSNGRVAWSFTNSYGDWTDAVLLREGSRPDTYLTPDGERQFDEFAEVIEVRGGAAETLVVRETIWGPVRSGADFPVEFPDGGIAISWTAHHADAVNFSHLDLETVTTVDEAVAVANRTGIPPQNFVAGDAEGGIAWTIAGQIPRRGGAAATFPADWSSGGGWQGWLRSDEYPRVVNPASGRIWTANSRVVGTEGLRAVGDGGYDLGARATQIRDALRAQTTFDADDMLRIQLDDRALFLARWRGLLLDLLDEEALRDAPGRAAYRDIVENWIPRASTDSAGYRLVRAFRSGVSDRVFTMLVADPLIEHFGDGVTIRQSNQFEGPLWQMVNERPAHLLAGNVESWDALMLGAVDEAIDFFAASYAGGLEERTWGERNTASIRHPLSRALPLLSFLLDMPALPLAGDSHMPRVQGRSFGASERFAVAPGAEDSAYLHMPSGQSGHPLSPYYARGHDDWVEGRATPFLPGPPLHRLRLAPGD